MASSKQCDFFENLLAERQLPEGTNPDQLKADFEKLSEKSASAWIERLLELPEKGEVPPPF